MASDSQFPAFLVSDPWLTGILGKKVFHAKTGMGEIDAQALRALSPGFIDVKIDTRDSSELLKFQKAGFFLTDTNIQFTRPVKIDKAITFPNIRKALPQDESRVRKIASEVFLSNRFHRDPEILHTVAQKIKSEWVGNFFNGQRGDAMLIAEEENQVAGFILLLWNSQKKETVIDLIGIDAGFQGRGLARQLIEASQSVFLSENIRVGTQLSNPNSIYLYQRLGFSYESANYSLHLHI